MKCFHCGTNNKPGALKCENCGMVLLDYKEFQEFEKTPPRSGHISFTPLLILFFILMIGSCFEEDDSEVRYYNRSDTRSSNYSSSYSSRSSSSRYGSSTYDSDYDTDYDWDADLEDDEESTDFGSDDYDYDDYDDYDYDEYDEETDFYESESSSSSSSSSGVGSGVYTGSGHF